MCGKEGHEWRVATVCEVATMASWKTGSSPERIIQQSEWLQAGRPERQAGLFHFVSSSGLKLFPTSVVHIFIS